jgi:hypothetical protein
VHERRNMIIRTHAKLVVFSSLYVLLVREVLHACMDQGKQVAWPFPKESLLLVCHTSIRSTHFISCSIRSVEIKQLTKWNREDAHRSGIWQKVRRELLTSPALRFVVDEVGVAVVLGVREVVDERERAEKPRRGCAHCQRWRCRCGAPKITK